jgi:hypothetical protein
MLGVSARSSVAVGLGEGEGVGEVADFADGAVGEEDFHDVEADFYLGIFEAAEVIERSLGEQPAFARVHGGGGAGPVLGGAGLDLDEDEAVGVAEDEVGFAAFGAEVGGEVLEAGLLEIFFGGALAQGAAPQIFRYYLARQARFKLFQEVHRG